MDFEKLTPMMKQYLDIKEGYKDCILFFRLGDFYEMFFDDAIEATKILEIVLTGKSCGLEERVPMCGIPYHSAESYIQKLIKNGKKVAICEQTEDPKATKSIVQRNVIRIVTPSTNFDDESGNGSGNLFSINNNDNGNLSFTVGDVIQGSLRYGTCTQNELTDIIRKNDPCEILFFGNWEMIQSDISKQIENFIKLNQLVFSINPTVDINSIAYSSIYNQVKTTSSNKHEVESILNLLGYISYTQKYIPENIYQLKSYFESDYLKLDFNTVKNLELLENTTTRSKKNTLFDILDNTKTSMGSRRLKSWITQPLKNIDAIELRLSIVENLNKDHMNRDELAYGLRGIYDVDRIIAKLTYESATPRDLSLLRRSFEKLPHIQKIIRQFNSEEIQSFDFDNLEDIYMKISKCIVEEPGVISKGDIVICNGYSAELDEYISLQSNSTNILLDIEREEREKTGIRNLKVKYNKVFGYYIEISNSNLKDFVPPPDYIRKQTLSNGERYINDKLKVIESKILSSQQKILTLQQNIFIELKTAIKKDTKRILETFNNIAILDSFLSLSLCSLKNNYTKPIINNSGSINIIDGRHPILEKIIDDYSYVPNDTKITKEKSIIIITGPNMGGKSTYMRQVALITIMAHIGCFVPAKSATINLTDAVYCRVGAADDLSQGQSTFMMEMDEVSYIVKNATKMSLIILDEVGRGTSTFDGMSIAYGIIRYISEKIKAPTLFSTHYHEITDLEQSIKNIKNCSVAVQEIDDKVVFLRKLVTGRADKSYGIHVAEMAKLPNKIIELAKEKLKQLESTDLTNIKTDTISDYQQLTLNVVTEQKANNISSIEKNILAKLKSININMLTPVEALIELNKIKNALANEEE